MLLNHAQEWGLKILNETPSEYVIGVDEVGLGACASPLVVCGAVFRRGWSHPAVKDSKKYTGGGLIAHKKRLEVARDFIVPSLVYQTTIVVEHDDIDALGMGPALDDAIRHAARSCAQAYPDSVVVVDGDNLPRLSSPKAIVAIPKGDNLVPAVSAASVIAKVTRDASMIALSDEFPGYDFHQHMGYFTEDHRSAMLKLGVCPVHRRSYKCVREVLELRGTS